MGADTRFQLSRVSRQPPVRQREKSLAEKDVRGQKHEERGLSLQPWLDTAGQVQGREV
jgi:hypothetical protein